MVKTSARKASTVANTAAVLANLEAQAQIEQTPIENNTIDQEGENTMTQQQPTTTSVRSNAVTARTNVALPATEYTNELHFQRGTTFANLKKGGNSAVAGLEVLHAELVRRNKVTLAAVKGMGQGPANSSSHQANRSRINQVHNLVSLMREEVEQCQAGNVKLSVLLAKMQPHNVLSTPTDEKFSVWDMLDLMQGAHTDETISQRRVPLRGIRNYMHLENYGYVSEHDSGWVINFNRESYIVDALTLHTLIMGMDLKSFQHVPFTQQCVFPTNAHGANYDGDMMMLPKGQFTTIDGEVVEFERMRLAMEHKHYVALVLAVAHAITGDEKYTEIAKVTKFVFGEENLLPVDRFAFVQLWDAIGVMVRFTNGRYYARSAEDQAKPFLNGGWMAKKGYTCIEELADHITTKNVILAWEEEYAQRQEKNRQDREAAKAEKAADTIPAGEDLDIQDHPF